MGAFSFSAKKMVLVPVKIVRVEVVVMVDSVSGLPPTNQLAPYSIRLDETHAGVCDGYCTVRVR